MRSKESGKVRYAYGVAMALLIGGTAFSLATGKQARRSRRMRRRRWRLRRAARRCHSPTSPPGCSRRWSTSRPSNGCRSKPPADPFEDFFRRFDPTQPQGNDNSGNGSSGGGAQPRTREAGSLGSGFIISPDGYVVTNNHLIQGANGTGTVDTVTVITTDRQRISGADRRPRRDLRPRAAQDRGPQPAVRPLGRQHQGPRRRLDCRDRQSLWAWRYGHRRHHLRASPRDHRHRRLRSLHPDRRGDQHGQ